MRELRPPLRLPCCYVVTENALILAKEPILHGTKDAVSRQAKLKQGGFKDAFNTGWNGGLGATFNLSPTFGVQF